MKDELISDLRNADCNDDLVFARLVKRVMDFLDLKENDIATLFGMTKPSVVRWKNGTTAPHPAVRRVVYREFIKLLER